MGLINKCKACFILQCKTSALLPTQTLNKKYPPFNVYCLHAWIEYRLKMEYTDLWSRCCLKVRALGYYCAFVICILCLLECIFRLQHAVECTLNPCLLCFFFYWLGGRYFIVMALSTCTCYTIWRRLAFLRGRLVRFECHRTFSSESSVVSSMLFSFAFLVFNDILLYYPGIKKQLGWYYKSTAAYSWRKWHGKVLTLEALYILCIMFYLLMLQAFGFIYAWLHKYCLYSKMQSV